jgi:hypothetical protein
LLQKDTAALADGPVAEMSSEDLIAYLTPLIRAIILDPLPEPGKPG